MRVICINALNRPTKVPIEQWIKEGEIYTVMRIVRLALQQDKLGLLLKEIKMEDSCFPYEFYDGDRFAIIDEPLTTTKEVEKEADLELI
jgi:hypothetical protein